MVTLGQHQCLAQRRGIMSSLVSKISPCCRLCNHNLPWTAENGVGMSGDQFEIPEAKEIRIRKKQIVFCKGLVFVADGERLPAGHAQERFDVGAAGSECWSHGKPYLRRTQRLAFENACGSYSIDAIRICMKSIIGEFVLHIKNN